MVTPVAAADANRNFSTLLREVREGATFVVTSHGRPVASILPFRATDRVRDSARAALFERLKTARVSNAGAWTRDDLHED